MTYNEVLECSRLLSGVRSLRVGGKALMETLSLRAVYNERLGSFFKRAEEINKTEGGEGVSKEELEKARLDAISATANEDCGMERRRYSRDAFVALVEAASTTSEIRIDGLEKPISVFDWFEGLYQALGPLEKTE